MKRIWRITYDQTFEHIDGSKRYVETIAHKGDLLAAMESLKRKAINQTFKDDRDVPRNCTSVYFVGAEYVCDIDH